MKTVLHSIQSFFQKFISARPSIGRILLVTGSVIGVGIVIFAISAKPADASIISWGMDLIAETISFLLLAVASLLGKLLVVIIDILIGIVQYNDFIGASAVETGWEVVRDLCNMFFVLILLVIAFGTILRIETYKYNRLLGKLVLMALLINFSRTIAGFFIDVSQVVMLTFVNAFADTAALNFTNILQLRDMLGFTDTGVTDLGTPSRTEMVGLPILIIIMLIVAIMTMLAMVVVFLVRIIMLWVLVVLSPLAYLFAAFPMTQKYASQWWSKFGQWTSIGPTLAFFIWLALAVTVADSADIAVRNPDTPGVSGTGLVAASISKVSSSGAILGFMMAIGFFVVGLSMASSLGGVAGSFAGKMSGRISAMGAKGLRVAGSPFAGAYKAAQYGVQSGGRRIARLARTNKKLQLTTPEYWKGFSQRGKRLDDEAKQLAAGAGEFRAERMFKGEEAALDREEMARRNVINTKKGDMGKEMGKAADSRQAMEDLSRRVFATGGHEGELLKQAFLEMATERGNLDDVFQAFGSMYKDQNNIEFRERVNKQFGKLGHSEGEIENMFEDYNADTVKKFTTSYLGLDKGFLDEEQGKVRAENANDVDKDRLRALASISEVAKDVGHWEQYFGAKDSKTGNYYVMNEKERREEIVGEAKKRGLRDFLKGVAPHVFRQRTGKMVDGKWDYVPDAKVPDVGSFEEEMFKRLLGGQHIPELRQMQSRVPDQLISHYFDEFGNFIDTEAEAVEKGFEPDVDENQKTIRSARQKLKDSFEKLHQSNAAIVESMWNWKYRGKPDNRPDKGKGEYYPWEDGYQVKINPQTLDRFRDQMEQYLPAQTMRNKLDKEYNINPIAAKNSKQFSQLKNVVHDPENSDWRGLHANENVSTKAREYGDYVRWDVYQKDWTKGTRNTAKQMRKLLKEEKQEEVRQELTEIIKGLHEKGSDLNIEDKIRQDEKQKTEKKVEARRGQLKNEGKSLSSAEEKQIRQEGEQRANERIQEKVGAIVDDIMNANTRTTAKKIFDQTPIKDNVGHIENQVAGVGPDFDIAVQDLRQSLENLSKAFTDQVEEIDTTKLNKPDDQALELFKTTLNDIKNSLKADEHGRLTGTKREKEAMINQFYALTKTIKQLNNKNEKEVSIKDMVDAVVYATQHPYLYAKKEDNEATDDETNNKTTT